MPVPDPRSALAAALARLDSTDWTVRLAAVQSIGFILSEGREPIDPADCIPSLHRAAGDGKWEIRKAAAEVLGRIDHKEPTEIIEILSGLEEDPNTWVRKAACLARARQKADRATNMGWELTERQLDPILRDIATRAARLDRKTLTPALLLQLAEQYGEEYYRLLGAELVHELRTAIAPVEGFATALKEELGKERPAISKAEQYVDKVLTRARYLLRLLNDLSDLTQGGKEAPEEFDLCQLLGEANATSRERLAADGFSTSGIKSGFSLPPKLKIRAVGPRLLRAFANLMANAMQAMPEGGKLVVSVVSVGDNRIKVEVGDSGCGMTDDEIHSALLRFRTTRRSSGGTGLGLPIAKRIIEEHGGTLQIESRPGSGTTVKVELPVRGREDEGSRA